MLSLLLSPVLSLEHLSATNVLAQCQPSTFLCSIHCSILCSICSPTPLSLHQHKASYTLNQETIVGIAISHFSARIKQQELLSFLLLINCTCNNMYDMIVNLPQRINGCVGPQGFNCHASSQSSIAEPVLKTFLCHAVGSGFRFLPICQTVLTFKASFINFINFINFCAKLLAQEPFCVLPICQYVIQRWPLRPVAELGINFCAPSRFLPIYQSISICYAVLTFQAFCRPGHKFLCWLRPQEPAPWSLCHPELVIEVSFEVLAPQTSKSELALQA